MRFRTVIVCVVVAVAACWFSVVTVLAFTHPSASRPARCQDDTEEHKKEVLTSALEGLREAEEASRVLHAPDAEHSIEIYKKLRAEQIAMLQALEDGAKETLLDANGAKLSADVRSRLEKQKRDYPAPAIGDGFERDIAIAKYLHGMQMYDENARHWAERHHGK